MEQLRSVCSLACWDELCMLLSLMIRTYTSCKSSFGVDGVATLTQGVCTVFCFAVVVPTSIGSSTPVWFRGQEDVQMSVAHLSQMISCFGAGHLALEFGCALPAKSPQTVRYFVSHLVSSETKGTVRKASSDSTCRYAAGRSVDCKSARVKFRCTLPTITCKHIYERYAAGGTAGETGVCRQAASDAS